MVSTWRRRYIEIIEPQANSIQRLWWFHQSGTTWSWYWWECFWPADWGFVCTKAAQWCWIYWRLSRRSFPIPQVLDFARYFLRVSLHPGSRIGWLSISLDWLTAGMDEEKLLAWHRPRAKALLEAGCDLFACETVQEPQSQIWNRLAATGS